MLKRLAPNEAELFIASHRILKPCPFCGSDPVVHSAQNDDPTFSSVPIIQCVVSCTGCDASIRYNGVERNQARKAAIEKWQTRADRPTPTDSEVGA